MYVLISSFAASLLLIAIFFVIKEREVYRGSETRLTAFLRRHSPSASASAHQAFARALGYLRMTAAWCRRLYATAGASLLMALRALVVILAQKMIRAVKGERLLSGNGGSSMYLKHLKEHKDNTAGGAPQV